MPLATLPSPLGPLSLIEAKGAITRLLWGPPQGDVEQSQSQLLRAACAQLNAYFTGELERFDLPLAPDGSEIQKRACSAIAAIPFGETRSYGALARDLGVSAQAMGQLCGGNPIAILIPCHRVVSARGLGGFSGAGGIEDKIWLLRHERAAGLLI